MKWQPIETFRGHSEPVLIYSNDTVGEAWFSSEDETWWWANTDRFDYHADAVPNVTHWMPLPEPPTDEQ